MAGILRLSNTGTGNGQSTITTAASGDTTYTLPSGGGTFVTTASTQALTVPFASGTAGAPSVTFIGDTDTGLYSPGANQVALSTSGTGRLFVSSAGLVGIGTSSPSKKLQVSDSSATSTTAQANTLARFVANASNADAHIQLSNGVDHSANIGIAGGANLYFALDGSERARIDSSGRLLVGTSSSPTGGGHSQYGRLFTVGNTSGAGAGVISIGNTAAASAGIASETHIGSVAFTDSAGFEFSRIESYADATAATGDYPGRLVFSTTADGASSPTERMRIGSVGFLKASDNGTYHAAGGSYHEFRQSISNSASLVITASNGSYVGNLIHASTVRAATNAFSLLKLETNTFSDAEFNLTGDGNGYADGSWIGGGADYAEYFEWSDLNPTAEDRRGISVVLDGDKIREALTGEDPIGVISGNPSVVGDSAWNKWSGKYLRDEYGTYILDANGDRQLNPAYDPDVEYIPREQRPEWDCVGLMGKLHIRKGQVTGSRWIKMRDINDSVEEWLVR